MILILLMDLMFLLSLSKIFSFIRKFLILFYVKQSKNIVPFKTMNSRRQHDSFRFIPAEVKEKAVKSLDSLIVPPTFEEILRKDLLNEFFKPFTKKKRRMRFPANSTLSTVSSTILLPSCSSHQKRSCRPFELSSIPLASWAFWRKSRKLKAKRKFVFNCSSKAMKLVFVNLFGCSTFYT